MSKYICLIGLPASGKSKYAEILAKEENAIIHSSDKLREEMFGDINKQEKNRELFEELKRRVKLDLNNGKNVIMDACNISHKRRKSFLDELQKINCIKICYFIATPYEICLRRNLLRERIVPEYVIKNMYKSIYVPQYYENWDDINIIYTTDIKYDYADLFKKLENVSQDNPHHTLSIGWHCMKCAGNIYGKGDEILYYAALLHDIGKYFTKEFKNSKGEITNIAHYYNHHLVSAYDALFYLRQNFDVDEILEIVKLITWHMQPFFIDTEKLKNKFIKLVSQDFYDKLMILHEADVNAK